MAIIDVTEDPWKRQASESLQDGITGTRVFNVYSDSQDETEGTVLSACPVGLGDLFPGTLTAQCISRVPQREPDTFGFWTVTCQFKSILNQTEQSRIDDPNPLDRTARISWASRTIMTAPVRMPTSKFYNSYDPSKVDLVYSTTEVSAQAIAFIGKPRIELSTNSATDPFDPPVEAPKTEWIASVTKNVTEPPGWLLTYDNAVNDAEFKLDGLTVPKGCAKLEGIRISERMKENGTEYRQVSLNIILRSYRDLRPGGTYVLSDDSVVLVPDETAAPEPWDIEVLDEGMRTYNQDTGIWTNVVSENGTELAKPVAFNGAGAPLKTKTTRIPEFALSWVLKRPFSRKPFSILPGLEAVAT